MDGGEDRRTDGWRGGQTDGRTDKQMDGKSPHSTGILPLSGPLPCFLSQKPSKKSMPTQVEQGKGTADHLMPLGDWFYQFFCLSVRPSIHLWLALRLNWPLGMAG